MKYCVKSSIKMTTGLMVEVVLSLWVHAFIFEASSKGVDPTAAPRRFASWEGTVFIQGRYNLLYLWRFLHSAWLFVVVKMAVWEHSKEGHKIFRTTDTNTHNNQTFKHTLYITSLTPNLKPNPNPHINLISLTAAHDIYIYLLLAPKMITTQDSWQQPWACRLP